MRKGLLETMPKYRSLKNTTLHSAVVCLSVFVLDLGMNR
jgi:hypothetical protein